MAEADKGYKGEPFAIRLPDEDGGGGEAHIREKKAVRTRHEMISRRFKQFGVLKKVFRHSLRWHGPIFKAIVTIVQMDMRIGNYPYMVDYKTFETEEEKENRLKIIRLKKRNQQHRCRDHQDSNQP